MRLCPPVKPVKPYQCISLVINCVCVCVCVCVFSHIFCDSPPDQGETVLPFAALFSVQLEPTGFTQKVFFFLPPFFLFAHLSAEVLAHVLLARRGQVSLALASGANKRRSLLRTSFQLLSLSSRKI